MHCCLEAVIRVSFLGRKCASHSTLCGKDVCDSPSAEDFCSSIEKRKKSAYLSRKNGAELFELSEPQTDKKITRCCFFWAICSSFGSRLLDFNWTLNFFLKKAFESCFMFIIDYQLKSRTKPEQRETRLKSPPIKDTRKSSGFKVQSFLNYKRIKTMTKSYHSWEHIKEMQGWGW